MMRKEKTIKTATICGLLGLAVVMFAGCSREDSPTAPMVAGPAVDAIDPDHVAEDLALAAGWTLEPGDRPDGATGDVTDKADGCPIMDFGREELADGIARYWWDIQVTGDPHDVIRLHRVVKERRPYRPIRTRQNVFALPGGTYFVYDYVPGLLSEGAPRDWGLACYLAANDVDVWGFDPPEVLVPEDCPEFSFMADWDLQFNVDRVRIGLAIARAARLLTGCGPGKMTLLGYQFSGQGMTGFAVLNEESQLPLRCRHVSGYVAIDIPYKVDDEAWRDCNCASAAERYAAHASGQYQFTKTLLYRNMALLSLNDPDGPSPYLPGYTNRTAGLILVTMTWLVSGFPEPYHYVAGVFGPDGLPVGILYEHPGDWGMDRLLAINPYRAMAFMADIDALRCDEYDLPYDDHLGDVTVPILAVGAGGGYGHLLDDTTDRLGSSDVTIHNVSLSPEMMFDVGDIDLTFSTLSPELVFPPILEWIQGHASRDVPEAPALSVNTGR